jgi:hypothetical protein
MRKLLIRLREGRTAADVPNRPNVGDVGGQSVADLDNPMRIQPDSDRLKSQIIGIWLSYRGQEQMASVQDLVREIGGAHRSRPSRPVQFLR